MKSIKYHSNNHHLTQTHRATLYVKSTTTTSLLQMINTVLLVQLDSATWNCLFKRFGGALNRGPAPLQATSTLWCAGKLDRDKNSDSVLAGVRTLQRAVKTCGETDFACLARRYNAATANEQARWAQGVQLATLEMETHLEGRPHLRIRKRLEPKIAIVRLATAGELL